MNPSPYNFTNYTGSAIELVMKLLAIDGPSGRETAVVNFIAAQLQMAGIGGTCIRIDEVNESSPFGGECGNLIVDLPGTIEAPRRVLMAHTDTVPLCVGCRPIRCGNRIRSSDASTGLGADDRAGVAVILNAVIWVVRNQLDHPPITLFFTVGEEVGMQGVRHMDASDLHDPAFAFNFDGGRANKLTIGANGKDRVSIDIEGISSHAGVCPASGASAITIASLAIARLHQRGLLGKTTVDGVGASTNIGTINGGTAINVVPGAVTLEAEIRSPERCARESIFGQFVAAFEAAANQVRGVSGRSGKVYLDRKLAYESYRISEDSDVVQRAVDAVRQIDVDPLLAVTDGGIDANWMVRHGIPTVSFGCGHENFHTVDEALNLDEFKRACRIAMHLSTTP